MFLGDDEEAKKNFELTERLLLGKKNKFFNESLYQFYTKNNLTQEARRYMMKLNNIDPSDAIVCTRMVE